MRNDNLIVELLRSLSLIKCDRLLGMKRRSHFVLIRFDRAIA
jgi:hypothetical protein